MSDARTPPSEKDPHPPEWIEASRRLSKALRTLEAMSHLPESAPELMAATSEWRAAKTAYEAVCAKIGQDN